MASEYDAGNSEVLIYRDGPLDIDPPVRIFLGNIFLKFLDLARHERDSAIETLLRELFERDKHNADDLMNMLALRVRTAFELQLRAKQLALRLSGGAPETVSFDFGGLLLESVVDRKESVSMVGMDELNEANVTRDEALRIATARMARETDSRQWQQVEANIWQSRYDDDYDFSRVVALGLDTRLPFDTSPILFAPSHSVCLVCDRHDDETLARMIELGSDLATTHRPFCQRLWCRDADGRWRYWQPTSDVAGTARASLQCTVETISQYQELAEYFNAYCEHHGEGAYIGTYRIFQDCNNYRSQCAYTLGVPSYLPRTDEVFIADFDNDESLGVVDWRRFAQILGPEVLMPVSDLSPPTFRLFTMPSEEQVAALRQAATR